MYELEAGTARLVRALRNRVEDAATVQRLAAILDYMPDQLKQDIQALDDFHKLHKREVQEDCV